MIPGAQSRDLKGTQPWTHFMVFLEVSREATKILIGQMLNGHGEMEVRGVRIDVRKSKQ